MTYRQVNLEGADVDYAGTLMSLDHTNRTARERKGKYKANKRQPRTRTLAGTCYDAEGNEVHISRPRNGSKRRRIIIATQAPEVSKMRNVHLDYNHNG